MGGVSYIPAHALFGVTRKLKTIKTEFRRGNWARKNAARNDVPDWCAL